MTVWFITFRAGQGEVESENSRRFQPGIGHIIAITDPGEFQPLVTATMLNDRKDVGHDLAGMKKVGKSVDDRHGAVSGKLLDDLLSVSPDHHPMAVSGHATRRILDRFTPSHLRGAGRDKQRLPTQLIDADLKRYPCPGG